jgi:acylphosphatase
MKIKFIIQGENVQEVGYRVFLFNNAFNYGISKFNAFNVNKNQVFAFVEGDEETLNNYVGFCKENKPEGAIVENILTEAYNGEIGDTQTFATILTLEQLNKGVPAILEIKGDIKEVKGDIKEMKGDIKEIKGDIKEMKGDIKEMKGDIKEMKGDVKQVLVKQGETIHEIRNLRSDMKLYLDTKFEEVFFEIGRIKEKIGLS